MNEQPQVLNIQALASLGNLLTQKINEQIGGINSPTTPEPLPDAVTNDTSFVPFENFLECDIKRPGHRGDLMLAICMLEANVSPYGDVVDELKREYFVS